MQKILCAVLLATTLGSSAQAEDWRIGRVKTDIPNAVAATEKSRVDHCDSQKDKILAELCNGVYALIKDRQETRKPWLKFSLGYDNLDKRYAKQKSALRGVGTINAYDAEVAETGAWIAAAEAAFPIQSSSLEKKP